MATKGNGTLRGSARRMEPANKAVLVCGGAGFLGSHLCTKLLSEGQRVICVDNFCTSDEDGIDHLLSHPRFELMRRDVATVEESECGDLAAIYNMACAASPIHYQRDPLNTLFSSVNGTNNLLRIAKRQDIPLFQASTSEIYGHPTVHPQTEKYWGHVNTVGPRACYDEGKRCAETLCFIYREEFGVPVRIARIFNTYGPGMRLKDGRVVINFIVQALRDEPITVYGDGSQTRSFCYVDDLIDGILTLMRNKDGFTGPVNLGNPLEVPVRELAERIVEITRSRSQVILHPLPIDDPPRRRPDISLAAEKLGWKPRTDLDTGLSLTIRDVERRLERGDESLLDLELGTVRTTTTLVGANAL
ncbi:MAG TPA: UDP-glucuronic acid decarboxylase family protein [Steroidobacteraceae bacterium]|nr:UDP-glucuronic acid decarboxylase family protein [Steroidobacteraceae bacterium]